MTDPTTTHHETCYREHHECAVARLDRLRALTARAEGRNASSWSLSPNTLGLLVAVRDITEGR